MSENQSLAREIYDDTAAIGRIFGFVGILIMVVLAIIALWTSINYMRLKDDMTENVTGKIVEDCNYPVDKRYTDDKRQLCKANIEYVVNGKTYSLKDLVYASSKVGDEINVRYNPEKPEQSTTSTSPKTVAIIAFVIAIVLLAVSAFSYYMITKYKAYAAATGVSSIFKLMR